MFDLYTKIVLTVIAIALVALVAQQATTPARALGDECGSYKMPCYVTTTDKSPFYVRIDR